MIRLRVAEDVNWDSVNAIAYDNESLSIEPELLEQIESGRQTFQSLIDQGIPCYGVTTGLGRLVTVELSEQDRADLPRNILRARAPAIGEPLPRPVARATMFLRLVNFLSGLDGVTPALCQFLVDRLNDGFTPWIPTLGHGMAADAIANTHCFQTFIGEGYVYGDDGKRVPAAVALEARGVAPFEPASKEGLALLNGIAATPAYAIHAHRAVKRFSTIATATAAVTMDAVAAPRDSVDEALDNVTRNSEVVETMRLMRRYLAGSLVEPHKLQSPVSVRVIPQVHGALGNALRDCRTAIEETFAAFTDNPIMITDGPRSGRFLSIGSFHDQALTNQVEHLAIALAHVVSLSERRLHRLLDSSQTGLNPQLAPRPGLDAGLVAAHKAAIDLAARVKVLAHPVSLLTAETSGGQEDYMSMSFPAIHRLFEMCRLGAAVLAYELLAALVALDQREGNYGVGVEAVRRLVRETIPALDKDRSPGPDVESLLELMNSKRFDSVLMV